MRLSANTGFSLLNIPLSDEEIGLLSKTFFVKNNIGYLFDFTNEEKTEGTLSWLRNYKNLLGNQETIEFKRVGTYFVFFIQSSGWIKHLKTIMEHVFTEAKSIQKRKLPILYQKESLKARVREVIQTVFELNVGFKPNTSNYLVVDDYLVRFSLRIEDKPVIITYDVLGGIKFGMGHTEETIDFIIERMIVVTEKVNQLATEHQEELKTIEGAEEFEYCEECDEPLLDEDDIYEGLCNECGAEKQ